MWKIGAIAMVMVLATGTAIIADEHRELGPHQHGHGTFNIAVEDALIKMELEVPGDDIVGFEHDPTTAEQTAALDQAKRILAAPLGLFKIADSAKCSVKDAKVSIQEEHHEHEGDADEDAKGTATPDHDEDHKAGEAHHNEFHFEYTLDCKTPGDIRTMDFEYFKSFKNAQELDVNVVTPKGQSKFEVTRDNPSLAFGDLM